jgi:hypothetical protein
MVVPFRGGGSAMRISFTSICSLASFVLIPHAFANDKEQWYKDHDTRLWWGDSSSQVPLESFCRDLRTRTDSAKVRCIYAGELDRDSNFQNWAHWALLNLDAGTLPKDLEIRNPDLRQKVQEKGGDDLLLWNGKRALILRSDPVWEYWNVPASDPRALAYEYSRLRKGITVRPDSAEREVRAQRPDRTYLLKVKSQKFAGVHWTESWGLRHQDGRGIANDLAQNPGADSSQLWNWLEPRSRALGLTLGQEHLGIVSYAFTFSTSEHQARLLDEAKPKVEHWTFREWTVGLDLRGGPRYENDWGHFQPFALLGFRAHRFSEDFQLKPGQVQRNIRFEMPGLNGSVVGLGLRLGHYTGATWLLEGGYAHYARSAEENYQEGQTTRIAEGGGAWFVRNHLWWMW